MANDWDVVSEKANQDDEWNVVSEAPQKRGAVVDNVKFALSVDQSQPAEEPKDRFAAESQKISWMADEIKRLRKINPGVDDDRLSHLAAANFDKKKKDEAAPKVTREEQYEAIGYSKDNAKRNAAFDVVMEQRLNRNQQESDADPVTGERVSIQYNPIAQSAREQAAQKERDALRKEVLQERADAQAMEEGPTATSLAQDAFASSSKILPVAAKGFADLASLATGGEYGRDAGKAIEGFQNDIDKYIRSDRGNAQARQFARDMADPNKDLIDLLAGNKAALLDQLLPQVGSMAIPIGAAGLAGKAAQLGSAAKGLGAAALAARVGKAEEAASIVATVFQNASDTFNNVLDKGGSLGDAYLAAGLTAPFTIAAGKLTGGGAETALALRLFSKANSAGKIAANEAQHFAAGVLKGAAKEGVQEIIEQTGQTLGEATGLGKEVDLNQASKEVAVAGALGFGMGGGVHVASHVGQAGKEMSVEDALIHALSTGQTVSSPINHSAVLKTSNAQDAIATAMAAVDSVKVRVPGSVSEIGSQFKNLGIQPSGDVSTISRRMSPVPQQSANPALPYQYSILPNGAVNVHGDPDEIRAAFPGERAWKAKDGVIFGNTRSSEILSKLGVANGEQAGRVSVAGSGESARSDSGVLRQDSIGRGVQPLASDWQAAASDFQSRLNENRAKDSNAPEVTLSPPDEKAAAQLQGGLDLTRQLFGVNPNVKFFSDPSPGSANGVMDKKTNTVWINTSGLTFNALGTGWHETHHVMQAMAEADDKRQEITETAGKQWTRTPVQKYRDRVDGIYNTMSISGRSSYAGNFLYVAEANASPEVQSFLAGRKTSDLSSDEMSELRKLRSTWGRKVLDREDLRKEMMADFVGNRATDKQFVSDMKRADPVGFGQWARNWLRAIDELLQSLRGKRGQESQKVDKYVRDLEKSRKIFQEALMDLKKEQGSSEEKNTPDESGEVGFSRKGVIGEVAPHPGEHAIKGADGKQVPKTIEEMTPAEKILLDKKESADRWDQQSDWDKSNATEQVARKLFQKIVNNHKLEGWHLSFSSGQYEGKTNPNFIIDAPESATREQLDKVARDLGYALNQKSMVVFDEGNTTGQNQNSFVRVVLPNGFPEGKLKELRSHIAKEFPSADSNTLINRNELIFGNFTRFGANELNDADFRSGVLSALKSFDYDGDIRVQETERYDSELIWPASRSGYLKGGAYESNRREVRQGEARSILRGEERNRLLSARREGRGATQERERWYDASQAGREYRAASRARLAAATASNSHAEVEYGTPPQEGLIQAVGVHYSQQRRNNLTSSAFGSGLKGAELNRLSEKSNADIRNRIYFYVDLGKGVTPESGVGGVKHVVKLTNLYNTVADKLGIVKNNKGDTQDQRNSNMERAVKEAGFDGFYADNGGNQAFAVLIGQHDISMPRYQAREWTSIDDINDLGAFNLDREYSEEDYSFEEPSIEELNAEIDAEEKRMREKQELRNLEKKLSSPKDVTVDQMKSNGLFPEAAFPFGEIKEDGYGLKVPMSGHYKNSSYYEIDDVGGAYNVRTPSTFGLRDMSAEAAVHHVKTMAAQPFIHDSGFDIASAYRKGTVIKLASRWKQLASLNGIFRSSKKSELTSFPEVWKDLGLNPEYKVTEEKYPDGMSVFFELGSKKFLASMQIEGNVVRACTMGLDGSGNLGTSFYAAAGQWAKNNGLKFYADNQLSTINTARRTEQSFSYALKTGDTGVMLPGKQNRVYGYNEDPKSEQDHLMNIGRLALAGMRNAVEIEPEIRRWKYDPNTDAFTDQSGRDVESKVTELIKSMDGRAFGLGRTTIARAVLTSQIIKGDTLSVKEFASPIAYQARGEDANIGEGWGEPGGLNPNLKKFLGNSKMVRENGVPIVMYHGTARDIQEFTPKQANAIFLTYSTDFADDFSQSSIDWMLGNYTRVLSESEIESAKSEAVKAVMADKSMRMTERKFIASAIKNGREEGMTSEYALESLRKYMPSGPNILPLVVRAEHPFDFRNKAHVDELMHVLMDGEDEREVTVNFKMHKVSSDDLEMAIRSGMWEYIEAPEVQDAIRNTLAHDAFFVRETGQLNLAVYDKNQVKSAIGNNGNYDLNDDRIDFQKREPSEDLSITRWAQSILNGRGRVDESKVLADGLPSVALSMNKSEPFGDKQMIVLDGHALDHARKHVEDGITAKMIGQIPDALKTPRMVTFQAPGQAMVMLPIRAENGSPVVIILKKDLIKGGGQQLRVTRFATTYPLTNSASYLVREIEKGNRVWLPLEEVSRLRDLLGSLNDTQGGLETRLTQTLARPASRDGNQAAKVFNVLSDEALVKKQSGDKRWSEATEAVEIPKDASAKLGKVDFSKKEIAGQTDRQYTPEQIKAFENVGFRYDTPTWVERIKAYRQDAARKLAQGIADQFAPIADLDHKAYNLMRLSKGASGAFEALLRGGKLKLTDKVYDFDTENRGGVVDKLLIPLGGEHHDFFRWIAALRAERLLGEDREHLFTPKDIEAIKTLADGELDFDYTIQNGPKQGQTTRNRLEAYQDSLKTFDGFNRNVMDMAEQSGLIDPESRHIWENEIYVPFYRTTDEDGFAGVKVKGGVVRQEAFKALKGGTDKLNADLLDNVLMNWSHLLDASAKNRAALAALDAAVDVGIAIEAPESTLRAMGKAIGNKKGVVWAMDEGRERYFLVGDPFVLDALTALQYAGMRNFFMDAMSTAKHWITVGVTASPFFKIRNLIRDSVQAVSVSGLSYNVPGNIVNGFKLSSRGNDSHFRLLAGGGTIHFATMYEASEAKRVQAIIESGVPDHTILNDPLKLKKFYRSVIEPAVTAYNELGNRGEEINRAALYDQLIKQGKSHAEASLEARDLMDFSMQGSFIAVRFLTQVVPFMNARIQGLYKLGKGAKEDPAKFSITLGAVAIASLALLAAYHDDDDWKKREEWDRNNFWWFKIGGKVYRIPKPFEIGAIATLAERGFERMFDKEMTNKRFMQQVMTLLGDNLSMNPIPQAVKPILDVYSNKDSFSGRAIESDAMQKLMPSERYNSGTTMFARGVGRASETVLGASAPSPLQIDHLMRGYFGWLGAFIVGAGDMIARPATDQPKRPTPDYWKVATGNIVSDVDSGTSRYVTQMYEQAKELEMAYNTYREKAKRNDNDVDQFAKKHSKELELYGQVEGVKKAVSGANKFIREIERSDMGPDKKRELIVKLKKEQSDIAKTLVPR